MDFNGEKDDEISPSSVIFLSIIEGFSLSGLIVFIIRLFLERSETAAYSKSLGYIGAGLLLTIIIFNYIRYHGKLYELKDYWKDEAPNKKILKGLLILIIFVLSWLPLILIGLYW